MGFIKHNATNNYTSKLLKVNYSVHECVIIALTVQRACNQTCSGRFHSAVNAGVCSPLGGSQMDLIGWGEGGLLSSTYVVFLLLDRVCVCVCVHIGALSLLLFTQYLFISLTLTAQRERRGEEGRGSRERAVALGRKRVRKGREMRSEQQSVVMVFWNFIMGCLSGAFEAGYARECDRVMEGGGGGYQGSVCLLKHEGEYFQLFTWKGEPVLKEPIDNET